MLPLSFRGAGQMTETPADPAPRPYVRVTGSLSRRMILVATAWIMVLLAGGGFALDRVLTSAVTTSFRPNRCFSSSRGIRRNSTTSAAAASTSPPKMPSRLKRSPRRSR